MQSRAAFAIAALSAIVVPIALLAPLDPIVRWVLLGYAAVAIVVGVALGLYLRRGEAQPVSLTPVAPAVVPESLPRPWPRDALVAALAHSLAPTPYRVLAADDRLRIVVDERDPRYVRSVAHWRPPVVVHWDLMLGRDSLAMLEGIDGLVWGAPDQPPQRTGRATSASPRVVSMIEAQHVREVRAPHPWRWITADVLAHVDPLAAHAGWSFRRGLQRRLVPVLYPFAREPR